MLKWTSALCIALLSASLSSQPTSACTDVVLNKVKGQVVTGRTMDYDAELGSKICFKKKGTEVSDPGFRFTGLTCKPLTWTSKYNTVMIDVFDEPAMVDGMNSEGLSVATLWQADNQVAPKVEEGTQPLANISMVEYVVENAKDLDEAKKLISGLSVVLSTYKGLPLALHWVVTDRSGRSMAVEMKNGRPTFFEELSQVGVLTNAPSYDQQLSNLKAQEEIQKTEPKAYTLPGDYKPQSRFVKSAFLISHLPEMKSTDELVSAATQILHNVEVPKGASTNGSWTQWFVVRDQTNLRYWFMGVNNTAPKVIDMKSIDFDQLASKRILIDGPGSGDISAELGAKPNKSVSAKTQDNAVPSATD